MLFCTIAGFYVLNHSLTLEKKTIAAMSEAEISGLSQLSDLRLSTNNTEELRLFVLKSDKFIKMQESNSIAQINIIKRVECIKFVVAVSFAILLLFCALAFCAKQRRGL